MHNQTCVLMKSNINVYLTTLYFEYDIGHAKFNK